MMYAMPILLALFAASAWAQEPRPDVPIVSTAGVFPQVKCHTPLDTDLASVCWVRTDLAEPLELGCTPATDPDTDVPMDLTIMYTEGVDAEVRCYVVDDDGNVSDYSENAAIADFTRPGRPYVVGNP